MVLDVVSRQWYSITPNEGDFKALEHKYGFGVIIPLHLDLHGKPKLDSFHLYQQRSVCFSESAAESCMIPGKDISSRFLGQHFALQR